MPMWALRLCLTVTVFIFSTSSYATGEVNETTLGIALYNQLKLTAAVPALEKEAQSGNVNSQYYLGEALRKRSRDMTPEAQRWYEMAASNGSVYAMIQLGRKDEKPCKILDNCPISARSSAGWLAYAKELAMIKAKNGDPEYMYLMYEITFDRKWLERSANAGYALSQYWMAVGNRQGEGFFFFPGSREKSVREWLRRSSEGGYPKAMNDFLEVLLTEGDMEGIRQWLRIAAETGETKAVSNYGAYISHTPDKVGYPLDLVKGHALFSLLKTLDGGGGLKRYAEKKIKIIAEKMTPEQIEQSKVVAEEWKNTHPPLSFYPDKLGD